MSAYLSSLWSGVTSSGALRGLILAGTALLSARALAAAAGNKRYKKKLPFRAPAAVKETEAAHAELLNALALNKEEFVALLASFIAHTEKLQNNPPACIPQEDLIADLVLKFLEPYKDVLDIRRVCYVAGRSNVIIKYHGTTKKMASFVGSHMDVVSANPAEFKRNPFELTVEGDTLYGRGVTDCLGHVAMLCCIFKQLAILKPKLRVGVAAVFIANEENSTIEGIGIDELAKNGELEFARESPLFWIDSADIGPTVGTAGVMTWSMKATGYSGHSGVPQNAINALSLGHEAIKYIQQRFYNDHPFSAEAAQWLYKNGSSLKPTRVSMPEGGVTNIPREVTFRGDVRFLPFFPAAQVKAAIEGYVKELNDDVIRRNGLPHSGGIDRFIIPNPKKSESADKPMLQGLIEWSWDAATFTGVACDMESVGYRALCDSIYEVTGEFKPFALTGSLPIIADLQAQGYDVQITGFGRFDAYHAADEYAKLSEFEAGAKIVATLINHLNTHA